MQRRNFFAAVIILVFLSVLSAGLILRDWRTHKVNIADVSIILQTPLPTVIQSPKPTPRPTPNPAVYGPCKNIPVLLYHHIQPQEEAKAREQEKISVDNKIFEEQMEYLASRGYTTITPDELLAGLKADLPIKPILITFDDAYSDFYQFAYSAIVRYGIKVTLFVPTGLINNPGYLSWEELMEMSKSGLIIFGDHTWSHKNLASVLPDIILYEISTAKTQLEEHGLGPVSTFAYPYGSGNSEAKIILEQLGFTSAFTTNPGTFQCAKLPFDFRRNRVGNAPLSSYGF